MINPCYSSLVRVRTPLLFFVKKKNFWLQTALTYLHISYRANINKKQKTKKIIKLIAERIKNDYGKQNQIHCIKLFFAKT